MGYSKLIQEEIPKQNLERVGERIGEIVFVELDSENKGIDVYYNRLEPLGSDEKFVIIISAANGDYSNRISDGCDVTVEYYIDVYFATISTPAVSNEKVISDTVLNIIGKLNYIFSHPFLKTLGFELGDCISEGGVVKWQRQDPALNDDSNQTSFSRIYLSYRIRENIDFEGGNPLEENFTGVKLELTEKGYKFIKKF